MSKQNAAQIMANFLWKKRGSPSKLKFELSENKITIEGDSLIGYLMEFQDFLSEETKNE